MLRRLAEKKRKKKRFKNKRDHEWVVQCHRCGLVGDNYETICSVCGEGKWQLITPVNIPAWDLLSRPSVGGRGWVWLNAGQDRESKSETLGS